MSPPDVLVYGGVAVDAIVQLPYAPRPGAAAIMCTETYRLGGGAGHTAEWLAAWGVPARLAGNAVGRDEHGRRLWGWLSQYPLLDLSRVDVLDGIATPCSRAVVFPDGHAYLLCTNFLEAPMRPAAPELLEGVKVLAVNFYLVHPEPNSARLAELAHERGIRLVATDVADVDHPALGRAEAIVNSAASFRESRPDLDPRAQARALQAAGGGLVVVTDGDADVFAVAGDGRAFTVAPPRVRAAEVTGAGDAFRAGLIYGLLQGWPAEPSVCWAAATAALQVQRGAAQDRPAPLAQVQALAAGLAARPV